MYNVQNRRNITIIIILKNQLLESRNLSIYSKHIYPINVHTFITNIHFFQAPKHIVVFQVLQMRNS